MQVAIINKSRHPLPQYKTDQAAGMDVCAMLDADLVLAPMQRHLVPTGLFIALPIGTEAQIRPRSGLAVQKGLTCLNSPGTIDSDYRGELKVLLINLSTEHQTIADGDRIAQIVFAKHETINWHVTDTLPETNRGQGGFGSTGL
jgi:dUTP pyrophosphatase